MQLWIWRNFRIELPDQWEMLQFSRDFQSGRCAFADRYQFRVELNWRGASAPPDFDRMIADYMIKLKDEKGMTDARRVRVGLWEGLEGRIGAILSSRFGRFFSNESCMIEIVLLWPESKDRGLEQAILDSVREEPERNGRFRRWRAFGMDLLASKELGLETCRIEPGYAGMTFGTTDSSTRSEKFERLGVVSHWLKGTVKEWLCEQTPSDVGGRKYTSRPDSGHEIETVDGEILGKRLRRWLRGPDRYRAAAWICPEDERLYHISCRGPAGDTFAGSVPAGERLSCCDELKLAL